MYVASNTKFSASAWAVKSVVSSSILVPPDKSGPDDDTAPAIILIFKDDKSASTMPSNLMEPEAPEASGAKDIRV